VTRLSGDAVAEISGLYARYAHYYDSGRAEEFARLFTDDGVFVVPGAEPVRGREAIAETARRGVAALPGVRHTVSTVLVDPVPGDSDGATGTAYVEAVTIEASVIRFVTAGCYTDTFALEEGRWRIREHRYEAFTGPGLRGTVLAAVPRAG
jgi:uncharacterized protein (TIGR02246 family)